MNDSVDDSSSLGVAVSRRPASTADASFLLGLYAGTRELELSVVPWSDEQKIAFVTMQFNAQQNHYVTNYPQAEFLVLESGGQSIGRMYLDTTNDELHLIDLALLPAWRDRGIGTAIIRELQSVADTDGKRIRLYVEMDNPARHLYERLGFQAVPAGNNLYLEMTWFAAQPKSHPEG